MNKKDRVELMIPGISEIMQDWTIDFAGEIYPKSSASFKHVLIICDEGSKWVEAVPMRSQKADKVLMN